MQLGAFSANVVVDGKPLEEYDIVHESPTAATCWITSEEGKSFIVEWKCHEDYRMKASRGILCVDGTACGCIMMDPGILGKDDTRILSALVDDKTERDLVFTKVQLSDDDSLLNKEVPKSLGQIRLTVERGHLINEPNEPRANCSTAGPSNGEFHERAKKATVHCVGFGQEKARDYYPFRHALIPNNDPKLTFTFKYRSLSILQANGIAPKPSPKDEPTNHEIDRSETRSGTLDDAAFREDVKPFQLNNRILELENELKRLRDLQTSAGSEDRKPKRIKREEQGDRRLRRGLAQREVIDLT